MFTLSKGHYNNTYKDLVYSINRFDITTMFLFDVISKVIYKKKQL